MADDQLRYLKEHTEELFPVLYDYACTLAVCEYGWFEGKTLPLGKTPEDIVSDVYVSYINGEGTEGKRIKGMRHFNSEKDLIFQLKGSVRSAFSALFDKYSTRNELLARTEEEMEAVAEIGSTDATPAELIESTDFENALREALTAHPKIKASQDLQDLLAAVDLGVTELEGQAEMLGKKKEQISQLRHRLKSIGREVVEKLNKQKETKYEQKPRQTVEEPK